MAWSLPGGRENLRVGIAIATKGTVSQEWAFAFAQIVKQTAVPTVLLSEGHFEIDYARNDLVDMVRKEKCTHVFFLDNDVLPWCWEGRSWRPCPEVIDYLLFQQYPIVSGLYWTKRGLPNLAVGSEDIFMPRFLQGALPDFVGRHIYVDMVGIGCCLIDSRVFDKVPYPWFNYYRSKERQEDGSFKEISEDFYFGYKASRAGFPTMALGEIVCLHEGRTFATWGNESVARLPASIPAANFERPAPPSATSS